VETISTYTHRVAAHCETGSTRNALAHAGLELSEPLVFGLGSGPAFFYLFFTKTDRRFPFLALRNTPGKVLGNVVELLGVDCSRQKLGSAREAMAEADRLLARGTPVIACVDMFYMKYLPAFLHIHAPFHFVVLVGRDGEEYAVSDPYSEELGRVSAENLALAWDTRAPFAKRNFVASVRAVPKELDLRRCARTAIGRTCRGMLLPPIVRDAFFFVGVEGLRTFARRMREWPRKYRGVALREGVLFTAVTFEDQGTGGGAFRLMYGAFLHELADRLGAPRFAELGARMVEHGQRWRRTSGELIALGKRVPQDEAAFTDFWAEGGAAFEEALVALSARFVEFADFEARFFADLRAAAKEL
jgi:hypothetical protein